MEPRFKIEPNDEVEGYEIIDTHQIVGTDDPYCVLIATVYDLEDAREICSWLNNK